MIKRQHGSILIVFVCLALGWVTWVYRMLPSFTESSFVTLSLGVYVWATIWLGIGISVSELLFEEKRGGLK